LSELKVIAHIHTDFHEKFGIPRQSGLLPESEGTIVFEPEYRNPSAVKGLDGFNYIWLLWQFEGVEREGFTATVLPPRLGGKVHMGVFATRSPYRPNPIGLSSVKLKCIEYTENKGPVLHVLGADLRDNTPIYDIKPYLPYADVHTDATDGFAGGVKEYAIEVDFPEELLQKIPEEKRSTILEVLRQDPRTRSNQTPEHKYGVAFSGLDVRFTVQDGVLKVHEVVPYTGKAK